MKTRTTITGLFAMLARPVIDAWTAERSAWSRVRTMKEIFTTAPGVVISTTERFNDRSITEIFTTAPCVDGKSTHVCVVEMPTEIVTPEPTPVTAPAPMELAVVPPAIVETTTPVSPAPEVATVVSTATKVRGRKPSPVMAGAARTTRPRKVKPAAEPVEPVEAAEPAPAPAPEVFSLQICAEKADGGFKLTYQPIEGPGPWAGVLTIDSKRSHGRYSLAEFPTGWDGRGFVLAKLEGGTDDEADSYSVFCGRNGQDRQCGCRGFLRWNRCKHISSVTSLISHGKL